MVIFLSVTATAFVVTYLLTSLLARPDSPVRILDYPNERSLHDMPIPRTGGLAIWAGGCAGILVTLVSCGMRPELGWIAVAAVLVGMVSLIDDRFHVPARLRFVTHLFSGGVLLAGGLGLQSFRLPGVELDFVAGVGPLLTLFFIVWMINLYNFMDGMDGFAGGMAVFGFGTLGLLGYVSDGGYFAALCWATAAAAGGFLVLNFPPARIFMGDTGASVLGLMAAALSLWADNAGLFPLWIAVLVFSPFIVDATITLFRRLIRKERFWEAHRSHYYQRLVQLGWGHRKAVLVEYVLMGGCAVTAIGLLGAAPAVQWLGLSAWSAGYILLFYVVGLLADRVRGNDRQPPW